ncbi:DUF6875 domain-containing protein [Streptomyces sp. NPDC088116]|uniref:DUF6875 domain-containing protein n=1 Tax=Streptomyces sp. NPDC088116 TaxID=3365825 RepID=UPI0037F314DB
MREHDDRLTLIELGDMGPRGVPEVFRPYEKPVRQIIEWASAYLCRPHPDLGRKGNVCPFVHTSMSKGLFYLAVCPGIPGSVDEVAEVLRGYRDWFVELVADQGRAAQYATILVLFPDLPEDAVVGVIDEAQSLLKADYVSRGLMIGEFHDGPPVKGGLWNPEFRPLCSPVPLLAVRHMVPTDFPFLKDDAGSLREYLRRHGRNLPPQAKGEAVEAAARLGLTTDFMEPREEDC